MSKSVKKQGFWDVKKTVQKMKKPKKRVIDDKKHKKDHKKVIYILQHIVCNTTINLYDIFIKE